MPIGATPMPFGAVGNSPAAFFDGQVRWSPARTLAMIAFEMPRNIQLAVPHKTTHCNWYSLRIV